MNNAVRSYAEQRKSLTTRLLLAVLLLLGLFLRTWRIGYLNFWGDEDITALAAQGILEHGYPKFPSGMIYFRSMLTTYTTGLSAAVLGLNETALRLPSICFSLATILVAYAFGKRLFSESAGLLAAFILTFSYWELEFGRHARMYAMFAFFYTLSLYAIYRGVYEGQRSWLVLSFLGSLAAVFSHVLGGTLGLIYLAAALQPARPKAARMQLGVLALIVILAAHTEFWLVQYGFQFSAELQGLSTETGSLQLASEWLVSLLQSFVDVVYLQTWNPFLFWLGVVAMGLVYWYQRAEPLKARQWLLPLGTLLLLLFHQVLWAALVLWFYLLCRAQGFHGLNRPVVRLTILILILFGLFWTVYSLNDGTMPEASLLERLRATLKFQSERPKFYYLGLLRAFPLMASLTGVGLLWFFHTNAGKRFSYATHFILLAFTLSLVATGFVKNDWVEYRLNFHLNPLFVILFAAVLVKLFERIAEWLQRARYANYRRVVMMPVMIIMAFGTCEQVYPGRITSVVARDYGSPLDFRTAPGSHLLLMPDHQGPAQYVKQNAQPDDIVIAMDWLEQSFYGGKVDYWLRTDHYEGQSFHMRHEYFDFYTRTQVVAHAAELDRIISQRGARAIWIVTASPYTEMQLHVSTEVLGYLDKLLPYLTYRGRDGKSLVYKLPAVPSAGHTEALLQ